MAKFQQSPGYQWQLSEGLRAEMLERRLVVSHGGAAIKAEETFGQGLANQDFTNYYNLLMGLSTLGENAAAGGASTANAAGAAAQQAGNTQSSIYGGAAAGLGGTINNPLSDKNFQNWISGPSSTPITPIGPGAGTSPDTAPNCSTPAGSASDPGYVSPFGNAWQNFA
jgi:hypothetical protein